VVDRRKWSLHTPGTTPGAHQDPLVTDVSQLAEVTRVTSAGVWFVAPDLSPGFEYGPAPWCVGSYASRAAAFAAGFCPHVGDAALVVFPGVGVSTPVVSSWWR
jgi:hypothetical protein